MISLREQGADGSDCSRPQPALALDDWQKNALSRDSRPRPALVPQGFLRRRWRVAAHRKPDSCGALLAGGDAMCARAACARTARTARHGLDSTSGIRRASRRRSRRRGPRRPSTSATTHRARTRAAKRDCRLRDFTRRREGSKRRLISFLGGCFGFRNSGGGGFPRIRPRLK